MDRHEGHGEFNIRPEPPLDSEQYRHYLDRIFIEDHDLTGVNAAWLGLPTTLGQPGNKHPKDGPGYLRALGAPNALRTTGANIMDAGDLAPAKPTLDERMSRFLRRGRKEQATQESEEGEVKNLDEIVAYSKKVMTKVQELLASGRKVVSIGGDHSFAFATIAGALEHFKGDLGVVWFDAHMDGNIPKYKDRGSITGNAHGMPVAHLMGLEGTNPKLTGLISEENRLKPENILYIGLKDLDPEEMARLEKLGIQYFSSENSTEANREAICRKIDDLQKRVGHIWASTDVDGVDQKVAPGTNMPNKGGLSYEMITSLAQYIGVATKLEGCDLAELAPKLDDEDDKTSMLVLELIARFLGGSKKRWDETAYLKRDRLKKSPRQKAATRKRLGVIGGLAAAAAFAIHEGALDRSKPAHDGVNSEPIEAVYDESLGRAGLAVSKQGLNFLPNLDPITWTADLGKNAVDTFLRGDFKQAAERYESATDTESKNRLLSQMMTYLHVALLKSVDQAEKNRVWEAVTKTVGKDKANELMGIYRGFLTHIDNKKIDSYLKTMGDLPPG